MQPFVSVVIPCYRSEQTLPAVVREITETMRSHGYHDSSAHYEIILVNDGSPDAGATSRTITQLAAENSHVVPIELARNFGQHAAIMAGFSQVRGDIVVCMDDDGQTPPAEMFKLIDKVLEGYDIVYASYGSGKKHSSFRRLGSKFNRWTNEHFMNIPKDLEQTSYFACKRYLIDNALTYKNPYPFVEGLLFQSVQSYCNVPVNHRSRVVGESGYNLKKLVGLWANGFTSFSVGPLRAATYLGFLCSFIGFLLVLFLIIRKIVLPDVNEGWTSLMACIIFIGGLLMVMLGLIGEYVGRIYISLNNAPQYVIRPAADVLSAAELQQKKMLGPQATGVGTRQSISTPSGTDINQNGSQTAREDASPTSAFSPGTQVPTSTQDTQTDSMSAPQAQNAQDAPATSALR